METAVIEDTTSRSSLHNFEIGGHRAQFQKRNSFWGTQAIVSSAQTIVTFPLGYPDAFCPEKTVLCYRTPSTRLQLEAYLTDLVGLKNLQLQDITLGSTFRKDGFFTISDTKKKAVILLAHRIPLSQFYLPFYKGNPSISQNGFRVKVKDLHRSVVLTLIRPTVYPGNHTDTLEVWLGDKGHLAGRIDKSPAGIDEYGVHDELGDQVYMICSEESVNVTSDGEKPYWNYLIYSSEKMELVGKISKLKTRRGFVSTGGLSLITSAFGYRPFGIEFKEEIGIVHKTLLLGALFLITARGSITIEKLYQKELKMLEPLEDKVESESGIPSV